MSTIGSNSDAAFTEVLDLSVNTDGFAAQMQQVVQIYTDAIGQMPDIDKVSGVAFSESIHQLTDAIDQMVSGMGEALGEIGTSMSETADVIETKMTEAANAVKSSQAEIVEALAGIREAEESTSAGFNGFGNFFQSLTEDIAASAGGILKSVLIFNTINEILRVTGEVIMAPFKAVGEGFTYLQTVQERGSQIQAALLQSVQFSKDWGTNVQIAGQQADVLVRKVDDFAAKLKVSSQTVQTGFTSFLEYGGRNLTGSLNDALGVSAIVTGALQTQTPNLESRKLISEMQKLAQGAAGDSDKLAASLGLSKDQLQQMVTNAAKYHDLYQEILAIAPGIVQRLGDANERQTSLVATLELYKTRWEALIAGPLFDQFTKILQDILGWVDKNGDQLNDIGINLGIALGKAASAAENFLSNNWEGLKGELLTIAATFLLIATTIAKIANATGGMIAEANAFLDKHVDRGKSNTDRELAKGFQQAADQTPEDSLKKQYQGYSDAATKRANDADKSSNRAGDLEHNEAKAEQSIDAVLSKLSDSLTKIASGDTSGLASLNEHHAKKDGTEAANTPLDNLHPKPVKPKYDNTPLRDDEQELRAEIEKTKTAYQEQYAAIQDGVTRNVINHKQAATQIKALYESEIAQINLIVDAQEKKAKSSGANPNLIGAGIAKMEQQRAALIAQAKKGEQLAKRAADAEDEAVSKAHLQALATMEIEYGKERLAALKQSLAEGYATQTQVFDAETGVMAQEYVTRRGLDQDEIDRTAEGTVARAKAVEALNILDAQYTAQTQLRAQQRIDTVQKEAQANFAHQQAMEKLQLDRLNTTRAGSDTRSESVKNAQNVAALALEQKMTQQAIANTAALLEQAKAKDADSEATKKLAEQLASLQNTQLSQFNTGVAQATKRVGNNPGLQQSAAAGYANSQINQQQQLATQIAQAIKEAQSGVDTSFKNGNVQGMVDGGIKVQALQAQLDAVTTSLKGMQTIADTLGLSFGKVMDSLEATLLGPNFSGQWSQASKDMDDASTSTQKMTAGFEEAAAGLSGLTNIGKTITGVINQYETGRKQGGVLGGVGSLLSTGPVSDALSMVPVVGALVKPLGDAFSFIGDMLVAQAKKIATQINDSITQINQVYQQGGATLATTIAELQQQRTDAISQLSGMKGGKAQLNSLLPSLNSEIASLQKQASDLTKNFEDQVTAFQSGGLELQSWTKTWQGINKQVEDYLAAGGDMATANQFLADNLAAQTTTVMDSLNQGEQQAIQDALNLNQLLQQRIDLQRQEQQTEFGITSQNAIEKRESTGVQVASQLSNQQYSYNEQLDALNYQITTAQQKVSLESQVFNIATDTATLQAQSNALTVYSLQEQLTMYQQMAQILQSTQGLSFTGSSFNPTVPGTGINGNGAVSGTPALNLTVVVNADGQDVNSQQFSSYLADAITAKVSSNRTTF